jgi:hypothetical protein
MQFELGHLKDGGLVLMCAQKLRDDIKHVLFYRDQRLFMLEYHDETVMGDLTDYEISAYSSNFVKTSSAAHILVVDAANPDQLQGFEVPLIQVGV